jgi:hypothetical protein
MSKEFNVEKMIEEHPELLKRCGNCRNFFINKCNETGEFRSFNMTCPDNWEYDRCVMVGDYYE